MKEQDGPDAFLDVKYEDLVQNDTNYINKFMEYCGLQGDIRRKKDKNILDIQLVFNRSQKKSRIISKKADFSKFHQIFGE